jgi:hypothetical protein
LPVPCTRKRSVAASPSGTTSRSSAALAVKRPTAPEKPGASGSGSTVILTGCVALSTTPPASKKPWRASPIRKLAAGSVSVPAFVGNSSLRVSGKRR